MISGPRGPGEKDGPREVHLVILDNGRSRIFADPELAATLRCIRCGACMNHCPVYTRVGGHAYEAVYPGPIGKILTPQTEGVGRRATTCSTPRASAAPASRSARWRSRSRELLVRLRKEAARARRRIDGARRRETARHRLESAAWTVWRLILTRAAALPRRRRSPRRASGASFHAWLPVRCRPGRSVAVRARDPRAASLHELADEEGVPDA